MKRKFARKRDTTEDELGYRLYSVGAVGKIATDDNPHFKSGVVKGTLFEIVDVESLPSSAWYPYEVKFFGKQFKRLNDSGPLLASNHIEQTKNMQILYGKVNKKEIKGNKR